MKELLSGPYGAGKTAECLRVYRQWLEEGMRTERILVLLASARRVSWWRQQLILPQAGNLEIYTYFGFIQREIALYWWQLKARQPALKGDDPLFLSAETAHYLVTRLVDRAKAQGKLLKVVATTAQLAVQVLDLLNLIAVNGLEEEEALQRLLTGWPAAVDRQEELKAALAVGQEFRQQCLAGGMIDYSLAVELYHRYLLPEPNYRQELLRRYRGLIIDDAEELVPTALDLVLQLLLKAEQWLVTINPEGGLGRIRGGAPELAWARLQEMAGANCRQIGGRPTLPQIQEIEASWRPELLELIAARILELRARGVEWDQIALLLPVSDAILETAIENWAQRQGIPVRKFATGWRLLDQPLVRALLTLAVLAHPRWHLAVAEDDLAHSLALILQCDPLRARLLARELVRNGVEELDLDQDQLRRRLGFALSERWERLQEWLRSYRQEPGTIAHFLQRAFGEILAPLPLQEEDLLSVRRLLAAALRLPRALAQAYGDETQPDQAFIQMILKGTLAQEVLELAPWVERGQGLLLGTVSSFLDRGFTAEHVFLLDVTAPAWWQGPAKELVNSWLLARDREAEDIWQDDTDQNWRKEQANRMAWALFSRCHHLYLGISIYNSQGIEQEGPFLDFVLSLAQTGGGADGN
ncbi:hypothetical protein CTH_1776 [Carboxydocella thermautotrophica]|nr:hypothetical protein CTH_1776 [Carboxydocella thermautotrophica]